MTKQMIQIRHVMIAAALGLTAAAAFAQESAGSAAKALKIGVVDLERVYSDSLLGKSYATKLEALDNEIKAEASKKQAEVEKLNNEINTLNEDYKKQQSVLSEDALHTKEQEVLNKNRSRDALVEDGRRELERMQARAQQQAQIFMNEFQIKIRPHIESATKERGLDLLIDRRVVHFVRDEYDLSSDVIVRADEAERAAKPASGAAKPATKP